MYITTDDLKAFLDEGELAAIRRDYEMDGVDKLHSGIEYAEGYVHDRLALIYDINSELGKTGSSRNKTLQEIIIHISIWKLCVTFPTVQLDGKRHYMYEQAMKHIDEIEKGKLLASYLPQWPTKPRRSEVVWGSNKNFDLKF